jgi:hypothetical protein
MTPASDFSQHQLITEQLRGIIDTVAEIPGLTDAQRVARRHTAARVVAAFRPDNSIETMLAGHCVIYDQMLRDGAGDLLRDPYEISRLRARPGVLASGKMFLSSLDALLKIQSRALQSAEPRQAAGAASMPEKTRAENSPAEKPRQNPPAEKPAFVCQTMHAPRRPEPANSLKFGAVYRLRRTPSPLWQTKPAEETARQRLNGVSLAAMQLVAPPDGISHPGLLTAIPRPDAALTNGTATKRARQSRITPPPPSRCRPDPATPGTAPPSHRQNSALRAECPRYAHPTEVTASPQ